MGHCQYHSTLSIGHTITETTEGCFHKFLHVEQSAVPDFDWCRPVTTELEHTFRCTTPSWREGWAPFSQPVASVLHIFIAAQLVGSLEPAVLLKRYQPGVIAPRPHFDAVFGNDTLRSASVLTVYELQSGPVGCQWDARPCMFPSGIRFAGTHWWIPNPRFSFNLVALKWIQKG